LRVLYKLSFWAAIIFYVLGIVMKLFVGGKTLFGIPPVAWINQGTIVFLLFTIVFALLHYLPEIGE